MEGQSNSNPASFERSAARQSAPREVHFILQKRYEVVSHLGQGGMGTVYMARDLRLANRYCVVKKLRDDFFREEDKKKALEFFQREAEVLSPLKHPNIVSITDSFDEEDNYYLVMEYVEGENLHQMLNKRGEPFPEEQVLQWAIQIADVLNFLHSNDPKVIYRDLKPSNVMIDTKDRVKLVDFGIARPYAKDSDNTHVVSAGYSPPEQYWGAADPRSDIYALGATMHFLLTGQEPLALQVCSPRKINPTISEHIDQIVQRATAQDVWLRYQTATEMQRELEYIPRQKPRLKLVQAAAGVVGLVAVLTATYIGISKVVPPRKDSADKTQQFHADDKQIKEKDREIAALKWQNKELQVQRQYQEQDKIIAPEDIAVTTPDQQQQQQQVVAPQAEKSKVVGTAFKEMDEAQLTDPEGLTPLEEDSQKKGSGFPLFGGGN